jgi:hypothetical protein
MSCDRGVEERAGPSLFKRTSHEARGCPVLALGGNDHEQFPSLTYEVVVMCSPGDETFPAGSCMCPG